MSSAGSGHTLWSSRGERLEPHSNCPALPGWVASAALPTKSLSNWHLIDFSSARALILPARKNTAPEETTSPAGLAADGNQPGLQNTALFNPIAGTSHRFFPLRAYHLAFIWQRFNSCFLITLNWHLRQKNKCLILQDFCTVCYRGAKLYWTTLPICLSTDFSL